MIPGLRAANVIYKNQRTGELTILNSPTKAYVSEKTAFPDETYVTPFEELFDLDNNILLNSLEQENSNRFELALQASLHRRALKKIWKMSLTKEIPKIVNFVSVEFASSRSKDLYNQKEFIG